MAIQSFRCAETRRLFERLRVKRFVNIEGPARRKLSYLDAARDLSDLRIPPGNRLEALRGGRSGQHSIRINPKRAVSARRGPFPAHGRVHNATDSAATPGPAALLVAAIGGRRGTSPAPERAAGTSSAGDRTAPQFDAGY